MRHLALPVLLTAGLAACSSSAPDGDAAPDSVADTATDSATDSAADSTPDSAGDDGSGAGPDAATDATTDPVDWPDDPPASAGGLFPPSLPIPPCTPAFASSSSPSLPPSSPC